jgi:flagellar hook assembly protein FlgD
VSLEVYDVAGRLVSTLVDGELDAGRHQAKWDGTNNDGKRIPAGIYFSRLDSGGKRATEKVILVK